MSNHVVLQWSRLGDLLQSRVLLLRLRERYPQDKVILCGDIRYAAIAARFPELSRYIGIDLAQLAALARHGPSHAQWLRNIQEHDSLYYEDCAAAYILTLSSAAVVYSELLRPQRRYGYQRNGMSMVSIPPVLPVTEVPDRSYGEMLLADRWASLAGTGEPGRPLEPLLDKPSAPGAAIGIVCDAGETHRIIPPEWGAALAADIIAAGFEIVLLGARPAARDDPYKQRLFEQGFTFADKRGKTDLAALAAELAELRLVIGPDSGALHLTASVDTPVLGLYFGGARAVWTGPYTARALVVQDPDWTADSRKDILLIAKALAANYDASELMQSLFKPRFAASGIIYERQPSVAHPSRLVRFRQCDLPECANAGEQRARAIPKVDCDAPAGVSIIIPECGSEHYTDELLLDLDGELDGMAAEVILVSSGVASDRKRPDVRIPLQHIVADQRLSFAQSCNRGAQMATMPQLLFLNNDVRISTGQLRQFLQFNGGDITSPLLIYPDGIIQNAGVDLQNNHIIERNHGDMVYTPTDTPPDALSAVALRIGKNEFDELKGFDEEYVNGYEDLDLCLKARRRGYRLAVDTQSQIIHFRGSTVGRHDDEIRNRNFFERRWQPEYRTLRAQTAVVKSPRTARIVLISDEPAQAAGSCLRWIWPLQRLGLHPESDFIWLPAADSEWNQDTLAATLRDAEVVVVFRPLASTRRQQQLKHALIERRIPLVVDFDDLIFRRFPAGSPRGAGRAEYERQFMELLRLATRVTVATEPLRADLANRGINAEVLALLPDPRMFGRPSKYEKKEMLRIGFFGTPAHMLDLGSVLPALENVLNAREQAMFYWWGCRPGPLAYHPQVRQGGPVVDNYERHLQRLHNFGLDIAIVPLLDTEHGRARSPVKYYEYAAAGIPAIFSTVDPYRQCVRPSETGLLVDDSTSAWEAALLRLMDDDALRAHIANNSRIDAKRRLCDNVQPPHAAIVERFNIRTVLQSARAKREQLPC